MALGISSTSYCASARAIAACDIASLTSVSAFSAISSEVNGDIDVHTCIATNAPLNTNSAISLPSAAAFAAIATVSASGIATLANAALGAVSRELRICHFDRPFKGKDSGALGAAASALAANCQSAGASGAAGAAVSCPIYRCAHAARDVSN